MSSFTEEPGMSSFPIAPLPLKNDASFAMSTLSDSSNANLAASESGASIQMLANKKTNWRAICLGTFIAFLCSVENNIIGMSEWPYMSTIDEEATSTFFGLVTSVCRVGHALFALLFGFWAYKTGHTRFPLLAGRFLALIGCIFYLLVELVPTNRRYAMLLCYFLFGTGFSTAPLLRSYIARMSVHEDRARAYALFNVSVMISIIISPIGQLIFTGIAYPGYQILPSIRIHIYSAPIWLALITNIVAIVVIGWVFEDPEPEIKESVKNNDIFNTSSKILSKFRSMLQQPFVWFLVILCLFLKMISFLTLSVLQAISGPMMMTTFGFNGKETVQLMAIAQGSCGILALGLSGLIVIGKLNRKVNCRYFFLFSLAIVIFMYFSTYPWPGFDRALPSYNETDKSGCDPSKYTWCLTARSSSPYLFLPIMVLVMGFAFPSGAISLDTIYSKVLGNIDQSLMQSLLIIAEDCILIVGPVFAATMYTASGIGPLWLINGCIVISGLFIWLYNWRLLEPYDEIVGKDKRTVNQDDK